MCVSGVTPDTKAINQNGDSYEIFYPSGETPDGHECAIRHVARCCQGVSQGTVRCLQRCCQVLHLTELRVTNRKIMD